MITIELAQEFIKCRDDYEYFKDRFCKNSSYVAAKIIHKFIFFQYTQTIVMGHVVLRESIRDEINFIISEISEFFQLGNVKKQSTKIESEHGSTILFCAINDNWLRGRSLDLFYCQDESMRRHAACLRLKPSDHIPNLYEK